MADLRTAIINEATRLGISPVDLATVISYETAGTFDPAKAGPTTQWGQHRGLIQWGEVQADKYGVDFNDPAKQMQAVSQYLIDAGVQPGMGILDVYSAINAGKVGRYNASDANNGGAPGTVRDKVEKQMGGHRDKAVALLGGEFAPQMTAQAAPGMAAPMPVQTAQAAPQASQRKSTADLLALLSQPTPQAPAPQMPAMPRGQIQADLLKKYLASSPGPGGGLLPAKWVS
jgi:hypothetical protein